MRYPEGREDTTGIPAEPWHLRYVGRKAALEMRKRGWVLEEWHEAHHETNEGEAVATLDILDKRQGLA